MTGPKHYTITLNMMPETKVRIPVERSPLQPALRIAPERQRGWRDRNLSRVTIPGLFNW